MTKSCFAWRSIAALAALALVLIPLCMASGCGRHTVPVQELNLYIWSEYVPPTVLAEFTQRTGIKVNVDNYDSNETLLQKLQSGAAGYDLCVPSDYMIKTLIAEKLIRPIDGPQISGFGNLDKRFLDRSFDPGNRFSVPYLWGTTGIGYNRQQVKGPVDSWAVLFDPQYGGKILMLDDMRECFTVALKRMGKSLNTTDPATLRQAADMLKAQKKLVKTYNSGDYDNILLSGDVVLAHGYNGQIGKLAAKDPGKFAYAIPKEGGTQSQDALVIPVTAPHPENARKFIEFVLEPRIAAEIVNGVNYASPNAAARPFIKPEILNNPAVYPPDELLRHCESMEDLGEATKLMDELWTEIKGQ